VAPVGLDTETIVADVSLLDVPSNDNPTPGNALPAWNGQFPNPRKIGIATKARENGTGNVYYCANGHIREVSGNLNTQVGGWRPGVLYCTSPVVFSFQCSGTLDGTCAPGSGLCGVPVGLLPLERRGKLTTFIRQWGDSIVLLHFQASDSVIHEMRMAVGTGLFPASHKRMPCLRRPWRQ
jgi:hypothetical protein